MENSSTLNKRKSLVIKVGKARHLPGRDRDAKKSFRTYCKLAVSHLVPNKAGGEEREEFVLRSEVLKGTSNPDFRDTGANAVFVIGGGELVRAKRGKGELEFDYSKAEGRTKEAAASSSGLIGMLGLEKVISVSLELKEKNAMIGATSLGQCKIEYESLLGSEEAITSDYVLKVDGVATPNADGFQKQISVTTALVPLNPPPALLTDEDFESDDDEEDAGNDGDENEETGNSPQVSAETLKELSVAELRRQIRARGEEAPLAARRDEIERALQELLQND